MLLINIINLHPQCDVSLQENIIFRLVIDMIRQMSKNLILGWL